MTILLVAALLLASDGPKEDRTAVALERCLASPKAAPVRQIDEGGDPSEEPAPQASPDERPDGRVACFEDALRSYDRRIVNAYRSRLKKASPESAEWLSQTNQAWLNYRAQMSGEVDTTSAARDHALWLEGLPRR